MKALITAFALLSFVAASTVPLAAQAQTQTSSGTDQGQPKTMKSHKSHAKKSAQNKKSHKGSHKKKAAPMSSKSG